MDITELLPKERLEELIQEILDTPQARERIKQAIERNIITGVAILFEDAMNNLPIQDGHNILEDRVKAIWEGIKEEMMQINPNTTRYLTMKEIEKPIGVCENHDCPIRTCCLRYTIREQDARLQVEKNRPVLEHGCHTLGCKGFPYFIDHKTQLGAEYDPS